MAYSGSGVGVNTTSLSGRGDDDSSTVRVSDGQEEDSKTRDAGLSGADMAEVCDEKSSGDDDNSDVDSSSLVLPDDVADDAEELLAERTMRPELRITTAGADATGGGSTNISMGPWPRRGCVTI